MTDGSEKEVSAEEARKEWMKKANDTWRESAAVIRKHKEIIAPLRKKLEEFAIAELCSWVKAHYPQVHFFSVNLNYHDIEVDALYDANKEFLDDPQDIVAESIASYINENHYKWEFEDLWLGDIDPEMLDVYEISQRRP